MIFLIIYSSFIHNIYYITSKHWLYVTLMLESSLSENLILKFIENA